MIHQAVQTLLDKEADTLNDEDVSLLTSYFIEQHSEMNDSEWANGIQKTVLLMVAKSLESEYIIKFIERSSSEFLKYYPRAYGNICELIKQECKLHILNGETSKAHVCVNKYLYYVIAQIVRSASNSNMDYFSFRSFSSYSLDDIEKEKISLAHPCEFNDPFDTLFLYWLDHSLDNLSVYPVEEQEFRLLLKKATNHIKMRCLVAGKYLGDDGHETLLDVCDLPVLMWSHYADSHRGFCVKYHFKEDFFKSDGGSHTIIHGMEYVDKLMPSDDLTIREFLFQKAKSWQSEREMRLLHYDPNNSTPYPQLDCKGAVQAIYLGVKCSDTNLRDMLKAIGDKDIPLYKMEIDDKNLSRFRVKRIG